MDWLILLYICIGTALAEDLVEGDADSRHRMSSWASFVISRENVIPAVPLDVHERIPHKSPRPHNPIIT